MAAAPAAAATTAPAERAIGTDSPVERKLVTCVGHAPGAPRAGSVGGARRPATAARVADTVLLTASPAESGGTTSTTIDGAPGGAATAGDHQPAL